MRNLYVDLSKRGGWNGQWSEPTSTKDIFNWRGVTIDNGKITGIDISRFGL